MNIINLGVRIIEDSDNRGSDNRGCTVLLLLIIIIIFFSRVYSECTEVSATSLVPLVIINFPEICAFMIDFSFTVWTKMRPLLAH